MRDGETSQFVRFKGDIRINSTYGKLIMGYPKYLIPGLAAIVVICLAQGAFSMSVRKVVGNGSGNQFTSHTTIPRNNSTTTTTIATTTSNTVKVAPPKSKTITITCKHFCAWNFKKKRYSRNCNAKKFTKFNLGEFCKTCQAFHCQGTYFSG